MTREMTQQQFHAALERNGFRKPVLFWVEHRALPGISFSMLFHRKGKLARRETIAHLIERRNAELDKRRKAARQAAPPRNLNDYTDELDWR